MPRLHHVNVVVPPGRTAEVAGFYRDVLGLVPVNKPAALAGRGGAWFAVDDSSQLHVSERDGTTHPDSHFGLVVDDFDNVLDKLRQSGLPFTPQEDVFGGRRGFTRDPAGNRVEVLEAVGELA